jgi:PAS domain S-box-containing protein/diguanylate cyclase (GGDEF)-like protein
VQEPGRGGSPGSHEADEADALHDVAPDDPQVARLERRLRMLAEHLPDMIFRYEFLPEPRFDYVSPASTSISGYTPEEHYEDPGLILDLIHPDDRELVATGMADPKEDAGEPIVLRWLCKDGSVVVTEQRYRLEHDDEGRIVAIEGVVRDVTARLRRQTELEYEATHDPVTGLANIRLLEEELDRHLHGDHDDCVVAVLRLDRFAIIRDLVGRSVAEAMMRDAGERLQLAAPAGGLVAKGIDDLFWVVFPEVGRRAGEGLLQTVHDAFRDPVTGEGREVYLTVSAGVRLVEGGSSATVESVLNDADTALRAVRGRGVRGTSRWFDPQLHQDATERLELEHDLRVAVGDGDVAVVYQPQYEMATGRIVGFEALARWDRPGHGPVSPALFIAVAEESGLIADLGDHVLFTAARQFARWRAMGLVDRQRVSVNVSRRQLGLPDLADSVAEIIAAAGLPPEGLTIEVTETAVMEAGDVAAAQLAILVESGVRISLDDFGTGHSALGSLRDLPVHELKIDRAFIANMVHSRSDHAICAAMVALGQGLGLDLVAEGVETVEQATQLRELGCPVGQGYLFSYPLTPTDLATLLAGPT